jgi:hypothetical protein
LITNPADTGRVAFRYEWEQTDERPMVIYPHRFWRDESERLTYEDAVEANPRRPGEGSFSYIARLSAIVVDRMKAQPKPNVAPIEDYA